MSQKLKQAITATRAGQPKEAQILLAQLLQENPNNTQAWYLLSLLVDSPTKKQAYLQKVVALDPTHEKAHEQLAQLQTLPEAEMPVVKTAAPTPEPSLPPAKAAADWAADERDAESIPDWLKETVDNVWIESEQPTLVSEQIPETIRETSSQKLANISTADESIAASAAKASAAKAPASVSALKKSKPAASPAASPAAPPASKSQPSTALMNSILWILIAGAVITFILLLYMIFS